MKDTIKLFRETIEDTPFPLPLKYYGRLQTLAGIVYVSEKDSHMDKDLKELSNYVQQLSNLDILEDHVKQLVLRPMDFHHMFDIGLDYRHQNLVSPVITFPETINFPQQDGTVSENVIKMVLDEFKSIKTFEFNVPKIISWIKSKINFEENMPIEP